MKRYIILASLLLLAIGGIAFWYVRQSSASVAAYRTEEIKHGELVVTVSATGTLEPEDVVDVGTQVAGMIREFGIGADSKSIDYGSPVEPGTVLARIDDALFKAKVQQSKAQVNSADQKVESARARLAQANAKVTQAEATTQLAEANLLQAKAKSVQATKDLARAKQLEPKGSIAMSDLDAYQAANDTNKAGITVSEAQLALAKAAETDAKAAVVDAEAAVKDAQAAVELNKAMLAQDEINLGYCTIQSTVKGTIIDRRVGIGQTVQSSFNTPSLFLIAKDLKRMKVWASINEADISQIKVAQPVAFTVDAYPGKTFAGAVSLIRLNATNTQNVVTYTVEVLTDNSEGELLPYMTANLKFEVSRRQDVLLVSNTALRYRPAADKIAPAAPKAPSGQSKPSGPAKQNRGTVWVEDGNFLKPIRVQIGSSDGNMTEVLGGELKEGAKIVASEAHADQVDTATNPFATKIGGKKQ